MFLLLLPNHGENSLCKLLVRVNKTTVNNGDAGFTDGETELKYWTESRSPNALPLTSPSSFNLPALYFLDWWFSNRGDFCSQRTLSKVWRHAWLL